MQSVVLIFVMPCSCSQACYPVNVAHVGYSGCYRGGTVSWYVFAKNICCDLVDSVNNLSGSPDTSTFATVEQARQLSSRLLSCMAEQQGWYVPTCY